MSEARRLIERLITERRGTFETTVPSGDDDELAVTVKYDASPIHPDDHDFLQGRGRAFYIQIEDVRAGDESIIDQLSPRDRQVLEQEAHAHALGQ